MRDRIIRKSMQKVVPKRRVQIKYLGELLRQCAEAISNMAASRILKF